MLIRCIQIQCRVFSLLRKKKFSSLFDAPYDVWGRRESVQCFGDPKPIKSPEFRLVFLDFVWQKWLL